MAQAITNKVLIQSYKYGWLVCDYTISGTTLSYTLYYHWDGGDSQLDNCYIKYKNGSDIWRNSGRVYNYQGLDGRGAYDYTIHSGTATITGSQTIQFGITKYSGANQTGEFSVTGGTAPSGGYATYHSSTWNSITFTTGVTNTGGGTIENHASVLTGETNGAADNITTWDVARHEWYYDGYTASSHKFENCKTSNASATWGGTPIAIKGLLHYKLGWWFQNSAGYISGFENVTRYLPPAPLQSITYTQSQGSTNVTVNISITGGNSTNNYSDTVTTYYRYSTNGGSTYSSWTSAGTGTPWTAKSASFTCAYKANVVVQAKQTYHSMDSEVKSISFTATSGTAPSGGSVTVTSSTWNSVTLQVSGVSYGNPSSISGRKLAIGVHKYNDSSTKRENQIENVTSATTTVNNSSIYPSGTAFQLKGMLAVYPYVWAWNTVSSATVVNQTTPYYLPPAPGTGSYSDQGDGDYNISYSGVAANNVTDYTASELKRTVRYKIDNGAWVYIDNDVQKALTTATTGTIHVPYQSTATVEAWDTYRSKNSEVTRFTITNEDRPVHLYGPVNGLSKEVEHLYGSVNGQSVKITKFYASVGGVAKEVFEDV